MRHANATRTGGLFVAVVAALVGGFGEARTPRAATDPPLITHSGVVASANPVASRVGALVLARGGNAVDAAVATAFALGVVEPQSSGIGGGGFALVYVAAEKKVYVYDFRETAPAALGPEAFVTDGKPDPQKARTGGLAVGVPGEVAGLARLSDRHGTLSWRSVLAPSIRLARDGYPLAYFETVAIKRLSTFVRLPADPQFDRLRAFITPGGRTLIAGEPAARPDLARTLAAIADGGAGAFYDGPIADDLVATDRAAGGVLTKDDLRAYTIDEPAAPLWGTWRGMKLATMPLPSSGGIAVLETLGLIEASGIDLGKLGVGSSAALHVIAEAMRHAFADRARFLGDSDAARTIAEKLLDPTRLARVAKRIDLDHVQPHDSYGDPDLAAAVAPPVDGGTSHLCVIDADGDAVALTTTINGYFGAGLITDGGVVLNDEIDDFQTARGMANQFGLVQSDLNLVGPGKRPLSSMSPTLVFDQDGKVIACAGSAGGPGIISTTIQILLDMFVWNMDPRAAIAQPRIHDQWLPDELGADAEIPADVVDGLARRGHKVVVKPWTTAAQAIRVLPDGTRQAASDPRHAGAPAAEATSASAPSAGP